MTATRAGLRPLRAAPIEARPERIRALDGMRALAVVAVLAFHLDDSAVPGGYLGVDVFFVLSGFLITSLLLDEWERSGELRLAGFWRRRVRRLLPPLVLTIASVTMVVPLLYDDVAGRVRGQALAALLQGANWFEALAALAAGGRRLLGLVAAGGAVLSFGALALAFSSGEDPSRLYYGTDTRAGTLLVGAALACALPMVGRRRPRLGVDLAGTAAALAIAVLVLTMEGTSAGAYRGGFLAVALLTAVVLSVAVAPHSILGDVLARRPLVWLGTRSYAVYLWHWPVFTATRPGLDIDVHGWALLALRLGLTLVLAEATTRLVTVALRPRPVFGPSIRHRLVVAGGVASAVVFGAGLASSAQTPAEPVFFVSPTTTAAPTTTTTTTTTTTAAVFVPVPETTTTITTLPPAVGVRALAVGESVLMGAGGEVQRALGEGTVVDADVARQPDDVLDALEARRAAGYLDGIGVLVVQLGTNGPIEPEHVERLAALAAGIPRVVAVTVSVPKSWQDTSNAALHDAAARFPWLRLADWHAVAAEHPEYLGPDGVHVGRRGATHYAALVASAATAP